MAVVVEFDGLDHGLSAGGRDVVDKGDDAFAPLLDVDVFGIGARLHRRLRRCLGLLDRIGVGFGFDREAVIGAQPEADLDDVFAHGSPPAISASGAPARIASALAIAASARSRQNGASGACAKTFRMPSRVS